MSEAISIAIGIFIGLSMTLCLIIASTVNQKIRNVALLGFVILWLAILYIGVTKP